jgi:NAD(P)H-dependent flavin oxidoreductase YrpB (nitropropane dioxygenase family)/acyl-CoA synthetase (AMP-forming)/AMP-acid ligase II
MALNIADLFEHAADVFPDRIAVVCGDRQVTYRELEERANRLAHHLASTGVGPGDHVGLYARNSIEATETLIASFKLRAAAVNINYRYVESELHYMLADSDLSALVYDRQYAPLVAAVTAGAAGLRGTVAIDDGSDADIGTGTEYAAALAAASPERDFAPRSNDDLYLIYTGGTTGYPKGVMWRHEDIWRTLGGGIDFLTGVPLPDEWEQSRCGLQATGLVKICAAPLIHGNAQVATLAGLFCGDTIVLLPRFDAHDIWRAVERHKVNLLVIIGDAMARPLVEAYCEGGYDASSLLAISSSAALFSPVVKDTCTAALPNVVITEAIGSSETGFAGLGSSETGFAGLSFVTAGAQQRGGPTVTPGPDIIVIDDDGKPLGAGQVGRLARGGHVPLGYYKDPAKTAAMLAEVNGKRYAVAGDLARIEDDDANTGGRPYGVDVVMPAKIPAEGAAADLGQLIPPAHRDFVEQTLTRLGVPPLADGPLGGPGGFVWLHSVARQHVEVAMAHPARLIANALGPPPPDVISSAHSRGMLVAALAGKADHARRHVASGVDIVVAQGYEAGGHTGEIASMVLVPEIVDAVGADVPVLAAGGIGCGRQIVAALALGAVGVWMGSAWLTSQEYTLSSSMPALREALLAATSSDTVRSRIYSGKPARLLKNRWTQAWAEPGAPEPLPMPLQNLLVSDAHQRLMRSGQPDVIPMPVGQIVGRMNEVRPVAEVISALVLEVDQALDRLDGLR